MLENSLQIPPLSENQVLHLAPDILSVVKTATVKTIYAGWFHEGAKWNTPNGCIIRRTVITTTGDETVSETMYANRNDRVFSATWSNRKNESYGISRK